MKEQGSGSKTNTTAIEFELLLADFSESQAALVCRAGTGQIITNEHHEELAATEQYKFTEGQIPENALACCSDSRTTKAQIAAERVGKTLVHRIPGGFLSIGKEMTLNGGVFVELVGAYGVDDIVVSQHSGCGAMNAIYTYHMEEGPFHGEENGAAYIERHKGPSFVKVCKAQKVLVDEVKKNGLDHYEKMGIPLLQDNASRFQQAMAIQQVIWDYEAVKALKAEASKYEHPIRLPEPLGFYQHILMSRTFVYVPQQKKFAIIPIPDNSLNATRPTVLPMVPGCSCKSGCTHE